MAPRQPRYAPDVELIFSRPDVFFDAVRKSKVRLPILHGELQLHAVGCYTVVHHLKQTMRRAEETAVQACRLTSAWPADAGRDAAKRLDDAWERILFNQFHDILAGSSIERAYVDTRDQLGFAKTVASDIIVAATRRQVARMDPSPVQRLVLTNLSDRDHRGYLEFEPWLEWKTAQTLRIADAEGYDVPMQRIVTEAAVTSMTRLLFKADVPAMGQTVLSVHHDRNGEFPSQVHLHDDSLSNSLLTCDLSPDGLSRIRLKSAPDEFIGSRGIRIAAFDDPTDTWSHGVRGFDGRLVGLFDEESQWQPYEEGPLRIAVAKRLRLGESTLLWKVILQAGEPVVRMGLTLHWKGEHQVVKLIVPTFLSGRRLDGCPGGEVTRPFDTDEYPFHNFTVLSAADPRQGPSLAVMTADAFGIDVLPTAEARLTLLRSPAYAHHVPLRVAAAVPLPHNRPGHSRVRNCPPPHAPSLHGRRPR